MLWRLSRIENDGNSEAYITVELSTLTTGKRVKLLIRAHATDQVASRVLLWSMNGRP